MSAKTTRFEKLLEAVPDALVGMDQKGVIQFVNRQTESLFGYDRDQLIGQPIEMLVPETLWQVYDEHRDDYFADPRTRSSGLDLVLSGRHVDGGEFPVNISLSHIDTGDVLLVITAVGDVTQRKLAVKNAELIAAIVQCSDDAIIGETPDGIVTSWNPAAARMFGYSSVEIIGRPARLLVPEDRADQFTFVRATVNAGHHVEHLETFNVRKDGTAFPISLTVSPIRDDGATGGVSLICRDMSEQQKALEAAQRMASIVKDLDDAILSGSLDGLITSFNPAAEAMFGYPAEEVIGRPADVLLPEDRKGEVKAVLAKVTAGQHVERLQTRRVRTDGTEFPILLTVSPIRGADGVVVGASVIYRDMTEQEHAAQYARSLIEVSLDPLMTISPEGKVTDVNEATVKITGVPREALIGTDFLSLIHISEPTRLG